MNKKYQKIIAILGKEKVIINESLAKYTSFKIGGQADLFYRAKTQAELTKAIRIAGDLHISLFILGGGTNVLISDAGFPGLVVKNETSVIKLARIKGEKAAIKEVYLEVDSGVSVNRLVRFALDEGFSGLEPFLGQPGTVGGAVYINVHNMRLNKFFGGLIFSAKLLTLPDQEKTVSRDYFRFGYDYSAIQETKEIVLSVTIRLSLGNKDSLWKRANQVLETRRESQPQGIASAGCIFRNISSTASAGYLLDQAGLKGKKAGCAMFSLKHANFIVNTGGAKASDVLKLITLAKQKVKQKFGITLEEEIVLLKI